MILIVVYGRMDIMSKELHNHQVSCQICYITLPRLKDLIEHFEVIHDTE